MNGEGAAAHVHRPEIDGLRAVAVLAVIVFHLERAWLPGGFAGVDVFFVISGYLVGGILLREKDAGVFSLARFWQRRIARILPACLAMAVATLGATLWLCEGWDRASTGSAFAAMLAAWANMHQLGQGDYFQLPEDAQPLLHCWSLAVEEQFYLIVPLVFALPGRWSRRSRLSAAGAAGLASFAACVWLTPRDPAAAFYLLPTRAWELLAGLLLALAHHGRPAGLPPSAAAAWCGAGLAGIVASFLLLREGAGFPGWEALLPVAATAACIHGRNAGPAGHWLAGPGLQLVGRWSYSLYLWHWPVFSLTDYRLLFAPPWVRTAVKLALTLALAGACHRWLEVPARAWLRAPGRSRFAWGLLAAALAIGIPTGRAIRAANYLDGADGADGSLEFDPPAAAAPGTEPPRSLLLMGDSTATMHAATLRDIAAARGLRFVLLSAAGGDPLAPPDDSPGSPLWQHCLDRIRAERPDAVVLACHWVYKHDALEARLRRTLRDLAPHCGRVVLVSQPPILPPAAERPALRRGSRPPFPERPEEAAARESGKAVLDACDPLHGVTVADIAPLFLEAHGDVQVVNAAGRVLFHDRAHLSSTGARLARPVIETALDARP